MSPVFVMSPSSLLHGFDFVSEGSKLGQPCKIALVGSDDGDSLAGRAHGDEGIVGESSPANLLVMVLNSKPGKHFSSLRPVIESGHEDSLGTFKVALQAFNDAAVRLGDSRV